MITFCLSAEVLVMELMWTALFCTMCGIKTDKKNTKIFQTKYFNIVCLFMCTKKCKEALDTVILIVYLQQ